MNSRQLIMSALQEDVRKGDITTNLIIPQNTKGKGIIIAKEDGVLAGIKIVEQVFKILDPKIKFKYLVNDGESFKKGATICRFEGKLSAILTGERTALNFLARLSGIATLTSKFVEKVKGTKVKILDTRKTTPLLRELEKYAVKCGGGHNHRMGLWDMILIKDNHIKAAGGIKEAMSKIKYQNSNTKIEIEVKNLRELDEALKCPIDIIMLDNMSIKEIKSCRDTIYRVRRNVGTNSIRAIKIEVSGGVNLNNVCQIAKTGVDYISVGALTHSAPGIDFSLGIE